MSLMSQGSFDIKTANYKDPAKCYSQRDLNIICQTCLTQFTLLPFTDGVLEADKSLCIFCSYLYMVNVKLMEVFIQILWMAYSTEEHEVLDQDCLVEEYDLIPLHQVPPRTAEAFTAAQKRLMAESFRTCLQHDARKLLGSERLFEKLFGPLSRIQAWGQ